MYNRVYYKVYYRVYYQVYYRVYYRVYFRADVQTMVYLGILVTRKYLGWQKILSKFTTFSQNFTYFIQISSLSCRIFCENIKIEQK